jgi:hypothetical protein
MNNNLILSRFVPAILLVIILIGASIFNVAPFEVFAEDSDNDSQSESEISVDGETEDDESSVLDASIDISEAEIVPVIDQVYDGAEKEPAIVIVHDSVPLVLGVDFEIVSWENNIVVGTATVNIRGIGGYIGEMSTTFEIVPASAKTFVINPIPAVPYTGIAYNPSIEISVNGVPLVEGHDYERGPWTNNLNAGKASATITGMGNYSGSITAKFSISRIKVSTLKATKIKNKIRTGSPLTPAVTVKHESKKLILNKDYTLTYSKNLGVGKATVKIAGIGNYSGTYKVTFKILPKRTKVLQTQPAQGQFAVAWKKVAGVSKYQVRYRVVGTKKWHTKNVSSQTSTLIGELKARKLHELQVRSYKTVSKVKYKSAWSDIGYAAAMPGAIATLQNRGVWSDQSYGNGGWNWDNWAVPDKTFYYTDKSGNIGVVTNSASGKISIDTYGGSNHKLLSSKTRSFSSFPIWGGFYAAPDGYFYLLTGRDNLGESNGRKVVSIRKYDSSWKLRGKCYLKGSASQSFKGVYEPFAAGSPSMVLSGNKLVVHMSRTMFAQSDGLHHQSNLTFEVNTTSMNVKTFDQAGKNNPYCSHSFNQFAKISGDDLVLVDHGDAYPRGIQLSIMENYTKNRVGIDRYNIFPFKGTVGDNYTGSEVTGLETGSGRALVVGRSVPHGHAVAGATGENGNKNVYVISANLKNGKSIFRWITEADISGQLSGSEPRIVKLSETRFVLLFNIVWNDGRNRTYSMQYRLLNENGEILKSESWNDFRFYAGSTPILKNNKIYWASSDGNGIRLYSLSVKNPITPVILPGKF